MIVNNMDLRTSLIFLGVVLIIGFLIMTIELEYKNYKRKKKHEEENPTKEYVREY